MGAGGGTKSLAAKNQRHSSLAAKLEYLCASSRPPGAAGQQACLCGQRSTIS